MSQTTQLEILDLRHFSAAQLAPLLRDEGRRWASRLHWDYSKSTDLLLEYVNGRVLPGYVALEGGKVVGYTFSVFEAAKAVIGDLYALGEEDAPSNPICETLLHHLLESLQATPAVDRIEAQLLMFPSGSLAAPFFARAAFSAASGAVSVSFVMAVESVTGGASRISQRRLCAPIV